MQALAGLRPPNPTELWASIALSQATYTVEKTAGIVGAIVIGGITMVLTPMHAIVRQRVETCSGRHLSFAAILQMAISQTAKSGLRLSYRAYPFGT